MNLPALKTTPRRVTQKMKDDVYARDDGRCQGDWCFKEEGFPRKIKDGERHHCDHIISLENGGTNEMDNLQTLCQICHLMKTAEDRKKAAKTRRIRDKHFGEQNLKGKPKGKIQSCGFQTNRDGRFKAKIGGGVVER